MLLNFEWFSSQRKNDQTKIEHTRSSTLEAQAVSIFCVNWAMKLIHSWILVAIDFRGAGAGVVRGDAILRLNLGN